MCGDDDGNDKIFFGGYLLFEGRIRYEVKYMGLGGVCRKSLKGSLFGGK